MTDTPSQRIAAIDVLRGLVIVLMALDHIRDYMHMSGYAINPLDPKQTTPLLYATRWVTHFCAPTFVFLSGVSIFLQRERATSRAGLASRLFTRGLWLVVLEFTVISFAWAWSIPYLVFLQVIFTIGVSMMVLSGLIFLPPRFVLAIGVAIIAGHNLTDGIRPEAFGVFAPAWSLAHSIAFLPSFEHPVIFAVYPVLPWLGIMAFGYGLGRVFVSETRDRMLAVIGGAMLVVGVTLRGFNLYGNPFPWAPQADPVSTVMVFLDVSKNPPSLQFVCIVLGLVLLAFPLLARLPRPVAGFFRTYGAVPLMAYVAHIFVVHAVAYAGRLIAGQSTAGMHNTIHNFVFTPEIMGGDGLPLWSVYVGWVIVLAIIYPLCRWWAEVKRTRRDWWLSYL